MRANALAFAVIRARVAWSIIDIPHVMSISDVAAAALRPTPA
jgi:hypothetical protein